MKESEFWFMDGKHYKKHAVSISLVNNNIVMGTVPQF